MPRSLVSPLTATYRAVIGGGGRARCLVVSGMLAAACSPSGPRLSETSAEIVVVSAIGGGNFGDVPVGSSAAPITIRVAPSGPGDTYDVVTAVTESCANFAVVPGSLPREVSKYCVGGEGPPRVVEPGARAASATGGVSTAVLCSGGYEIIEYSFPATFTPTVAGAQSCVITVTLDGGPKTVMVTGNGLPPPREIDLSRTSLAFGDVRRTATSSPQTVVVSNTGSAALTISSASVSGAAFSLGGAASTTIAGNSSYTYTLTCAPANALGPLSGTFTIVSDDPDEGTLALPLSCTGVDSNLTVQPSPIAVTTRVDEPREVTVELVNSGGAPMDVTSVTIAGNDLELVAAPTGLIPAGGTMQARLRYMARAEADISGMLTVSFDGQTRAVPVSARAKTAAMSISPDGDVDLGAVCVGTSKEQTFSALGAGGAGFVISNVAVSGEGFALATAAGPINVAGAGANTVAIRAVATPVTPGPMTGSVRVTTDIPGEAPRAINVTALAIAEGVGAAPASHDFDLTLVNEPSSVQSISIANCSGGVLAISGVAVEGPDAADFRVITEPSRSIAPSGTSSMLLEMRARTPGAKVANLVISHGEGSTVVPLSGEGYLPRVEAERIGTYYACSAQGGSGAWLLGIGLGAMTLLRRRRR
jgi:hypothetical protein